MAFYLLLRMKNWIEESLEIDESGQTLIEYALILLFVAIAIIGALIYFGDNLEGYYNEIANKIPGTNP